MLKKSFWEERHKASKGRYNRVTDFARYCHTNFLHKKKGHILDLCTGKGADAIFFHNKGFKVTALDYSSEAIKQFNELQNRYNIFISSMVTDITHPFIYDDKSFDVVYSRAGLYYFDEKTFKKIILEIQRVLKSEGLLMFQIKSVNDKKFGKGNEIEKNMFQEESGYVRKYYSKQDLERLLADWNILVNEERKVSNGSVFLEVIAEKT